ncbi:hypothetical protein [Aequorivita marina]|nr:hypothetical protein [Aequorivita sp. S2608]MDS1297881.1 hypothetical protein [Aequorivita sp. S2608]
MIWKANKISMAQQRLFELIRDEDVVLFVGAGDFTSESGKVALASGKLEA